MENGNSRSKGFKKFYVFAIILLLITNVITIWFLVSEKKTVVTKVAEIQATTQQKDSLRTELNNLLTEYESLKTNNDSINSQLESEKEKIKKLISELNAGKVEVAKYKRELSTLREIMKSYITQIDSLNTRNQILKEENVKVKSDFEKSVTENKELTQKNVDLKTKVDVASVIETNNIAVKTYKSRNRTTTKAKKVEKIEVCFSILKNPIALSGNKTIYVRIARPDELVLTNPENIVFVIDGKELVYSATRDVEYNNKKTDLCIFYDNTSDLIPGIYYVDLFTDGYLIGTSTFKLD